MPFMMDQDMLVDSNTAMDDLFFGTQPQTHQDQPKASPWQARYDELVAGGCSQKIAWSRVGSLARINTAANSVVVQVYFENPEGQRGLSAPALLDLSFHGEDEIVHVDFNQQGLELAVVDVLGRISIHNAAAGINRMSRTARRMPELPSQQEGILALQWLGGSCPISRPVAELRGTDSSYTFAGQRTSYGPLNPHPNSTSNAMFFLSRKGVLSMMYTVPFPLDLDSWYEQIDVPLEGDIMSGSIHHASFGLEHGAQGVLLTTCDQPLMARVYRISVNWNYPTLQKREPLPRGFRPQPTILVERICAFRLDHQSPEYITDIKVIAALKDTVAGTEAPIQILATSSQRNAHDGEYSSRMQRYELHPGRDGVHPGFLQLSAAGSITNTNEAKSTMAATKQTEISSSHGIISSSLLRHDTLLAITERNGAITFYDCFSMTAINETSNSSSLRYFVEVGFAFSVSKNVCHVAISPNATIAAAHLDNDERDIYILQHGSVSGGGALDDIELERISAVLTLTLATSQAQVHDFFDVLPIISSLNNPSLCKQLLNELWSKQGTPVVFDSSSNELMMYNVSPHAQRMLIMQISLTKSPTITVPHRLAWLLLNLRHILCCFITVVKTNISEANRISIPTSVLGLAEWHLDLVGEILNELILATKRVNAQTTMDQVVRDMMNNPTSPVLPLFLTTQGRMYLALVTQYIRTLRSMAKNISNSTQVNALAWRTFAGVLEAHGLPLDRFESCCAGMNIYVKEAWTEHTDTQRFQAEWQMTATGVIPEVLYDVVTRLLSNQVDRMLEDDSGHIRLGLRPMRKSGLLTGNDKYRQRWDVIRKVPLHGVQSFKVCTRCSSMMQNFQGEGRKMLEPMPQWLVNVSKHCICGSPWMIWE